MATQGLPAEVVNGQRDGEDAARTDPNATLAQAPEPSQKAATVATPERVKPNDASPDPDYP